jgi:hypothetical protein
MPICPNKNALKNLFAESETLPYLCITIIKQDTLMKKITSVEELCNLVGCTLENEETAQMKVEQILNYLHDNGVITEWNADVLDWVFSDEETY